MFDIFIYANKITIFIIKEIIATLATILLASSYIPQIIKGYKTKKLDDVSMGFLVILATGLLFWMLYGFLNEDLIFIIANLVNVSLAVTLIGMKVHYAKK